MGLIIFIILLFLLLGGVGYGYRSGGPRMGGGIGGVLGLILIIFIILWLMGFVG